jgi:hypothetical protein
MDGCNMPGQFGFRIWQFPSPNGILLSDRRYLADCGFSVIANIAIHIIADFLAISDHKARFPVFPVPSPHTRSGAPKCASGFPRFGFARER